MVEHQARDVDMREEVNPKGALELVVVVVVGNEAGRGAAGVADEHIDVTKLAYRNDKNDKWNRFLMRKGIAKFSGI